MNCTVVDLVAAKPVGRTELADLGLHLLLQRLQPRELVHPPGQSFEIRDDQRAQRGIALRCGDPGVAVDGVRHGNRNVLHSFTVTQFTWSVPAPPSFGDAGDPAIDAPRSVAFCPATDLRMQTYSAEEAITTQVAERQTFSVGTGISLLAAA
jgi:hypothetical protein